MDNRPVTVGCANDDLACILAALLRVLAGVAAVVIGLMFWRRR